MPQFIPYSFIKLEAYGHNICNDQHKTSNMKHDLSMAFQEAMEEEATSEHRRYSEEPASQLSIEIDANDDEHSIDGTKQRNSSWISQGCCPVAGVILGTGTLIFLAAILYTEAINGDRCLLAQEQNSSISCKEFKLSSDEAITAAIGAFSATSTLCAGLVELLHKSPVFIEGYFNDVAFGQRVELGLVILLTLTAIAVNMVVLLQAMLEDHTQNFISSSIGIVIIVPGIIAILTTAGVAAVTGRRALLPK